MLYIKSFVSCTFVGNILVFVMDVIELYLCFCFLCQIFEKIDDFICKI